VSDKSSAPKKTWLANKFDAKRFSLIPLVLAVLIAFETFNPIDKEPYSAITSFAVTLGSIWAIWQGTKKRASWSLTFVPILAIWAMPLAGAQIFTSLGMVPSFLLHAGAALAFAVAAYGFLAFDRKPKK
jgi:hypothetical protein